jgi:tetratricopeptide (TPR) repeat protein
MCNISLETQTGMQIHIARHLERIALFSIPRYVDMDEQNASGQGSDLAEVDADGSRNDDFEGQLDCSVSVVDLDEAIHNARKAVDATPEDHPDRAAMLDNLGSYLSNRYSRIGATGDLEEVIQIARQAVDITPKDHPDRAARLDNLVSYLLDDSEEVPVKDSVRDTISTRDDENLQMQLHDSELSDHSNFSHRQDPMDYDSEMPQISDLK